jgi:hypothetical protein
LKVKSGERSNSHTTCGNNAASSMVNSLSSDSHWASSPGATPSLDCG